jgi:hypothetical protein
VLIVANGFRVGKFLPNLCAHFDINVQTHKTSKSPGKVERVHYAMSSGLLIRIEAHITGPFNAKSRNSISKRANELRQQTLDPNEMIRAAFSESLTLMRITWI